MVPISHFEVHIRILTQASKIEYRFVDFFEMVKRLFEVNYNYYLK